MTFHQYLAVALGNRKGRGVVLMGRAMNQAGEMATGTAGVATGKGLADGFHSYHVSRLYKGRV